ncbi:MAG TPA: polymer-forming cytoskeletal protein [Deltaproteobacteria bacterium]|nr:polymer-forming cytoskeletal protein [Deltaproteobacteria bacterium]
MWEKKQKNEEIKAILGKGAEFIGKLIFDGSVRIDGDFEGEINGKGSLVIGEGAAIKATISVKSIYISGEVQGDMEISEKVHINSSGKFTGNVQTPVMVMEEGAFFDGKSAMSGKGQHRPTEPEAD